ncbi:MAG: helix-turn-helix domain-containing protein, partial [Candidatus Hydrogenedentes bacterium]|nr:helix-turn-helix domain-containing protein [Candidatus Hydrogenedentota bacterium]
MKIRVRLSAEQQYEIANMMRKTASRVEALRCRIILLFAEGLTPGEVQERAGCVRSTIYTTLYRFEDEGMDGFLDKRLYAPARKATADIRERLLVYLEKVPKDYGWQRSSWTLELLSRQLETDTDVEISPSHLRQVLKQEKCRRGRPRPALHIPVRGRREILRTIERLVERASPEEEVVYVDEADIDL